jgi:hypothetical protein
MSLKTRRKEIISKIAGRPFHQAPLHFIVELRAAFLAKLFSDLPNLCIRIMTLSNTEFLGGIIYPTSTRRLQNLRVLS